MLFFGRRLFSLTFNILLAILLTSPWLSSTAHAALSIPTNLSHDDRQQALRVIGLGTSEKLLSDPYPLGGFAGFEVGLSFENLPTDSLARLGSKLATPQQDITYPKLTIGKGVYNNLDFFIQFTPYRRADDLTQFGGMIRWGFYQGQLFPFSTSLLVHANSANTSNLLATRTYGADLMAGVSVGQVSIFGGFGFLQSNGTFTGGANGITASNAIEDETVTGLHTFVGANLRLLEKAFLALQLDRTEVPVVSAKAGIRF
jgi:hypothetical protein